LAGEKNSNFVKNTNCIEILKWAADKNYGHRLCYENLIGGGSKSLVRDRTRAELASYFRTAE